jgi:hypothetical protein
MRYPAFEKLEIIRVLSEGGYDCSRVSKRQEGLGLGLLM